MRTGETRTWRIPTSFARTTRSARNLARSNGAVHAASANRSACTTISKRCSSGRNAFISMHCACPAAAYAALPSAWGVLQSLAGKRLLRQFDYLSSVSGGGFIGSWLQVLIRESGGVCGAEEAIAQPRPEALRRLRAFTNYLTPQTGPFSTDTWAGVVLYLRNLLINWTVFGPLFLLLTTLPIFYRTAIWVCSDFLWLNLVLVLCAALALLFGVVRACSLLPSHRPPKSAEDATPSYASSGSIGWGIVYPAFGWTLLIPWLLDFATGPLGEGVHDRPWLANDTIWIVPVLYLALMTLGYRLAWWLQSQREDPGFALFRANFRRWIYASTGAALLT